MTTNYRWTDARCQCCGHAIELNLGNSAGGWKIFFQAHEDPPVRSWEDWKKLLRKQGSVIRDEYEHRLDPEDFIISVESTQQRDDLFDQVNLYPAEDSFHDSEGYGFYVHEFS